jgi:hypothetical protein
MKAIVLSAKSPIHRSSLRRVFHFIPLVLVCFGLAPMAQAVGPDTDGAIPGSNNGEGIGVLVSRTSGIWNTGTGFEALNHLTAGNQNTATGFRALNSDISGGYNTATGVFSLFSNTGGFFNSATGAYSLANNTIGSDNTANGYGALYRNTADGNTATGFAALYHNTTGVSNNAIGRQAATSITTGSFNQAIGVNALLRNDVGSGNIAIGDDAGTNITGDSNVTVGNGAFGTGTGITTGNNNAVLGNGAGLGVTIGSNNVLLGQGAGSDIHTTSGNVYIGAGVNPPGPAFEVNTIRIMDSSAQVAGTNSQVFIGGIFGATIGAANALVGVNANGQLGTAASSARYKKDIESMGESSEVIFSLRPVSFHYKGDETNLPCFGLIAEEVAKVNRDLILLDKEGKPLTVRYEQINAMLLNEFLKEHKKVEAQQASISQLKSEMQTMVAQLKEQAAQIQKVSAQVEVNKPAPRVVVNKP